jgi:hypothetical protein
MIHPMKLLKLILTVLMFFTELITYAQGDFHKGFLITNTGDTIHGQVHMGSNVANCKKCEFLKNDSELESYFPGDISAYRIQDEKFYVSKEILLDSIPERVFLEYLVNGIADLYYYKTFDEEYFFIEKEGQMFQLTNQKREVRGENLINGAQSNKNVYQVESHKYQGILNYLFSDAKGLGPEINHTRLEYKSLIKLTKRYHQLTCNEYECIDYSRSTRMRVILEPCFGMGISSMYFIGDPAKSISSSMTFGTYLHFIPVRASNRWKTSIGFTYSDCSFKGEYDKYSAPKVYSYNLVSLDYKMIRLPLMVEYCMYRNKWQPFAGGGIENVFLFDTYHTVTSVFHEEIGNANLDQRSNPDNNSYDFSHFQLGLLARGGIRYQLNDKYYLLGKMEFEWRSPVVQLNRFYDHSRVKAVTGLIAVGIRLN